MLFALFITVCVSLFTALCLEMGLLQALERGYQHLARGWYLWNCQVNQWLGRPCPCLACLLQVALQEREAAWQAFGAQVEHEVEEDTIYTREQQTRALEAMERLEREEEESRVRYEQRRLQLDREINQVRERLASIQARHARLTQWFERVQQQQRLVLHPVSEQHPRMFYSDYMLLDSAGEEDEAAEEEAAAAAAAASE